MEFSKETRLGCWLEEGGGGPGQSTCFIKYPPIGHAIYKGDVNAHGRTELKQDCATRTPIAT